MGMAANILGRRGFLGTLMASAAAVADPEALLWRPGKLISIPRYRVHVPKEHLFSVGFELSPKDQRLHGHYFENRLLLPAQTALKASIDAAIFDSGRARAEFLPMPMLKGIDHCSQGPFGPLPNARKIEHYEPIEDRHYLRYECRVRI